MYCARVGGGMHHGRVDVHSEEVGVRRQAQVYILGVCAAGAGMRINDNVFSFKLQAAKCIPRPQPERFRASRVLELVESEAAHRSRKAHRSGCCGRHRAEPMTSRFLALNLTHQPKCRPSAKSHCTPSSQGQQEAPSRRRQRSCYHIF